MNQNTKNIFHVVQVMVTDQMIKEPSNDEQLVSIQTLMFRLITTVRTEKEALEKIDNLCIAHKGLQFTYISGLIHDLIIKPNNNASNV